MDKKDNGGGHNTLSEAQEKGEKSTGEDVAAQKNDLNQQNDQKRSSPNPISHQENDETPNNEGTNTPLPQTQKEQGIQENTENIIQTGSKISGAPHLGATKEEQQGNGFSSPNNGRGQENEAGSNSSGEDVAAQKHDLNQQNDQKRSSPNPTSHQDNNETPNNEGTNTPLPQTQKEQGATNLGAKKQEEQGNGFSSPNNGRGQENEADINPSVMLKPNSTNYMIIKCGKTKNADEEFVNRLTKLKNWKKVEAVDNCHFVLNFCTIASRAGTDINAALSNLSKIPESKLVVLVVLYHTFNPDCVVPENTFFKRKNMISVNCLFHEDQGLLKCSKNDESLRHAINFITSKESSFINLSSTVVIKDYVNHGSPLEEGTKIETMPSYGSLIGEKLNYYILTTGNTLKSHESFIDLLKKRIRGLQEVSAEQCDFILVFCPVTSQYERNVKDALQMLNKISDTTPAVLVVLHHTFDSDRVVPDSSRTDSRENMIAVDCLFHEDSGFLKCNKNNESLEKATKYMKSFMTTNQALKNKTETGSSQEDEINKQYREDNKKKEKSNKQLKEKLVQFKSAELQYSTAMNLATKLTVIILGCTRTERNTVKSILLDKAESIHVSCSSQHIEVTQTEVAKRKITIVEPDVFNSELLKDKFSVHLRPAGPCAYLVVLSVSTCEDIQTGNLQKLITKIEEMFREKCWRNTMILFTTTDKNIIKNPDNYVKSANLEIQNVLKKCENRYHCLNINNVDDNQQSELLQKIENTVEGNWNASQVYQKITEMENIREKREAERHEMWTYLNKQKEFKEGFKKDVSKLKKEKEKREFIQTLTMECEIKIKIVEKIKNTYDKLAEMEEDRQFIKAILPENQIIWLTLPNNQDTQLDELYGQFLSVVKENI